MSEFQIMAGNELLSGSVVYLGPDGRWTREYESAFALISDNDYQKAEQQGRQAVLNNELIDPYLVKVAGDAISLPVHIRERIRYTGPTCKSFPQESERQS